MRLLAFLLLVIQLFTASFVRGAIPQTSSDFQKLLESAIDFFEVQQSGTVSVTTPQHVGWVTNIDLNDGKDAQLNLAGGYYQRGDSYKLTLPLASCMTLLAWQLVDHAKGLDNAGQTNRTLATLRRGTDYIMLVTARAGSGYLVSQTSPTVSAIGTQAWKVPDNAARKTVAQVTGNMGTDVLAECTAMLAASSIAFYITDVTYATTLLDRAAILYNLATTQPRKLYQDTVPAADLYDYYQSTSYGDELGWAALWLFRASNSLDFLNQTETYVAEFNLLNSTVSYMNWDDKTIGLLLLLAKFTRKKEYTTFANDWFLRLLNVNRKPYTPGGLLQFTPARATGGNAMEMAMATTYAAVHYGELLSDDSLARGAVNDLVLSQLYYLGGANPAGLHYMTGVDTNSVKNPQHKRAHGGATIQNPVLNTNTIVGALVAGPDGQDGYQDTRTFVGSAVSLEANVALSAVLAAVSFQMPNSSLKPFDAPPLFGVSSSSNSGLTLFGVSIWYTIIPVALLILIIGIVGYLRKVKKVRSWRAFRQLFKSGRKAPGPPRSQLNL